MRNAWEIGSWEIPTKSIVCGEPGKLILILFSWYGCFFPIRFTSSGILYDMWNTWVSPSISHSLTKCNEIFQMGIAWEVGTHFLPQSVGTFLPSDSYLWYILINGKHTAFSHQFLIARENAAKSTLWAPRLFFRSMIVSICSIIWWFLKRVNRKKWLGNFLFLKKRKINSRHPEIQSKIYQKKKST